MSVPRNYSYYLLGTKVFDDYANLQKKPPYIWIYDSHTNLDSYGLQAFRYKQQQPQEISIT